MNVLIIEDNADYSALLEEMLQKGFRGRVAVRRVSQLAQAVAEISTRRPDCALVDLGLSDAHGLQAIGALGGSAPAVALIVISGNDDEVLALQAVKNGAQDHLIKGSFDAALLAKAVRYGVERKTLQADLARMALHDPLTGLANRTLFLDRLSSALSRAKRLSGMVALLFIDLDHFKAINDQLGHGAGDQVLVTVARRIEATLRPMDTLARMGGDEFAVISEGIGSKGDVHLIIDRVRSAVGQPLSINGADIGLTASVGVAIAGDDEDADALLRAADDEMYRDKRIGRARLARPTQTPAPVRLAG